VSPVRHVRQTFAAVLVRALVRSGQRGQVLALFALALLAMFGALGLGIDGSRLLEERRNSQAAVDHAALTGARMLCTTATTSQADLDTRGRAITASNGFTHDPPTIELTMVKVGPTGSSRVHATLRSTLSTTFARAIGFTTLDVSTTATAEGQNCGAAGGSSGPGRAIHAGGTCTVAGKWSFDTSGSSNEVYGGVHANDDVRISGSGNRFTEAAPPDDPFTHVGTMNPGAGNTYQTGYPLLVPMPSPAWPSGWAPSDVTGGGGAPPTAGSFLRPYYDLADANGTTDTNDTLFTTKITSITKNGVYYTTASDGVDVGSIATSVTNVTIIAPNGPIKISHSGSIVSAFDDPSLPRPGILMLSTAPKPADKNCEEYTISLSGSSVAWNGVIWAPTGQIEMNGSSNVASNGALVGWSVKLNGSNIVIRYAGTTTTAPTLSDIVILQ
jgi:Flp pilus assembly protein TadG